jgi:hypothetical protein
MKRPLSVLVAIAALPLIVAAVDSPAAAGGQTPISMRGTVSFRSAAPNGPDGAPTAGELAASRGAFPAQSRKTRLLHNGSSVPQPGGAPGVPTVRGRSVRQAGRDATGWDSLSQPDSRLANGGNQFSAEPSDATLCAGNGYVMSAINTLLAVYTGAGNEVARVDINSFFGLPAAVQRPAFIVGPDTGDPKCYFDPDSKRWFFTSFAFDTGDVGYDGVLGSATGRNYIGIAVSKTSDPTGDWYQWVLDGTNDGLNGTPNHPGCPCLPDQPLIGADKYGFYITTNEFGPWPPTADTAFRGAQIYAFDKSAMVNGNAQPNVQILQSPPLAEDLAYSVQPQTASLAKEYNTSANGTAYFLSALDFFGTSDNRIAAWRLTNTKSLRSTPKLALSVKVLRSQAYASPLPMEQRDGDTPLRDLLADPSDPLGVGGPFDNPLNMLNSNDDRMQQAVLADRVLYGALNTQLMVAGQSRTGIAWFGVKVGDGKDWAKLDDQGYLAAKGNNLSFPAIAVGPDGDPIAVISLVGPDYFPSVVYTTLGDGGSLRLIAEGVGPADGFSGLFPFGEGVERWGDYHAAAFMNGRIYAITNYVSSRPRTLLVNTGTFVSSIEADD